MNSDTKTLRDYLSPQAYQSLQNERAKKLVKQAPAQLYSGDFTRFQETYRGHWSKFAQECIDWGDSHLTAYQGEILDAIDQNMKYTVRMPRGGGKTATAAILTLAWSLCHEGEDWKVITTASVWRQLEKFLWPEIHKWSRRLRWDKIGRTPFDQRTELLKLSLRLKTGEASAIASDTPESIEGAHADNLLYIFDESKSIPTAIWDSCEGAFSGVSETQQTKVLAISTPGDMSTRFYEIHRRAPGYEDWTVKHITINEVIQAGRRSQAWVDQRGRQWGKDSQLYHNHVLGEFKESDEDSIIPLAWIELGFQRWDDWQDLIENGAPMGQMTSAGVDIGLGGQGGDSTVIAKVFDESRVDKLDITGRGGLASATMATAGRVKGLIDSHAVDCYIDVIGIGAGVVDRLREQGLEQHTHPFNAAKKTRPQLTDKTKQFRFLNNRAAMWWIGREMLDPDSGHDIALPRDDRLMGELTAPTYTIQSDAVIKVESKIDIRKRLGRSTDRADAVLQAITGPLIAKMPKARVYVVGEGYTT